MGFETLDQTQEDRAAVGLDAPLPGLVLVFSGASPSFEVLPLGVDGLVLGRGEQGIDDARMSRRHARVRFDGEAWSVEDLGSRNGSAVDGVPVVGELRVVAPRVLRLGDSLLLPRPDVRPLLGARVLARDGVVVGPTLGRAWREIEAAAAAGEILHVTGETGAGKELAARRFHAAGTRSRGPFVAVNCATIPAPLADRLLFGTRRGAYSGADQNADGYLQAADGGTLFLDELAELDLQVQAKLLRVLETREVIPLGAATGRLVDLSVVSATHGGLREQVAAGKFRQDLFFRLGRPAVALPALRDRLEDIPWILRHALPEDTLSASFVESALLRHWPGNVRELVLEAREASRRARLAGTVSRLKAEHFPPEAGRVATAKPPEPPAAPPPAEPPPARTRGPSVAPPPRDVVAAALAAEQGNVSRAARALGVHRTQLRRWIERYGLAAAPDTD